MGHINATLNEVSGDPGLQSLGSVVRLFGPRFLYKLNTPSIHDYQFITLFTEDDEGCPSGMCLQSKSNFH